MILFFHSSSYTCSIKWWSWIFWNSSNLCFPPPQLNCYYCCPLWTHERTCFGLINYSGQSIALFISLHVCLFACLSNLNSEQEFCLASYSIFLTPSKFTKLQWNTWSYLSMSHGLAIIKLLSTAPFYIDLRGET